ncbi:MAG: hypothetical protein IPL61_24785 [Myxococcales bacterium]|nr:hypothetical protein [Myxococcales bacterium]
MIHLGRVCGLSTLALIAAAGAARADDVKTIVLAAESSTDPTAAAVLAATARAVKQAAPTATIADASLADSAFILGCDPSTDPCRDDVAGQLGFDRMVIVSRRDLSTEVVVRTRGGDTRAQAFTVAGADDRAGLATLEAGVPALLAPAVVEVDPGPGVGAVAGGGGRALGVGPGGVPKGALIVGVGGGVLLVGGVVLWGLAASTQGDIDSAPTSTRAELERLDGLEADARQYATMGNGLVIGGAVAVVAAGAWMLWHHKHARESVRVAPAVGPGVATVTLEASW